MTISAPVIAAVVVGAALLLVATVMALRPRRAASGLGWMITATFAYCILGLAAALQARESDGLRGAAVQLIALALAAVLALQCQSRESGEPGTPQGLASAARAVAWLTLLGLPPTIGFHAKVMVYRSLLNVGWGGVAALAMAAAVAGVLPAVWALGSSPPLPLKGSRAVISVALIALIAALGLYPHLAVSLASAAERLAAP